MSREPSDIFERIAALRIARQPAALATVVATKGSTPAKVPARMIVHADGSCYGTIGGGCVEADVIRSARDVMDTGQPRTMSFRLSGQEAERTGIACGGTVDVMIESLLEPHLVLVGAGHVAQATSELAARSGWQVSIVDDRPDFANEGRFPEASEITVCEFDELGAAVRVGAASAVISMTRGHAEDLVVLRWALSTPARYVGVLGSRAKRARFLDQLEQEGVPRARLEEVHMPVGLQIGAESVPEIALSICAELVALRRGATVGGPGGG